MTPPDKPWTRLLAERIAQDLLTYGPGAEADRLVQWIEPSGHVYGGWGKGPLTDRIEAYLKGTLR